MLVTAGLMVGLALVLRQNRAAGPAAARRGGQIVASIRGEPRSFNGLVARDPDSALVSLLTQGRLVRINSATTALEPWLAEKWESSADGRTHTMHLRSGVTWSDGTPFTSADVLFSLQAAYDPNVQSVVADRLVAGGQRIRAAAPDAQTVVFTFAGPSGPGVRLLDALPILPKHTLEAALAAGTLSSAWDATTPPAGIAGTGPFVLREYQPGQRLVFDRNPRYWRTAADGTRLPYLDRLVLEIVPDQDAELQRLQAGTIDMIGSALRPDDYAPMRQAEEDQGTLRVIELGVGPDADAFWFCLKPDVKQADPRFAFVQRPEFRQAISHAVDREKFAETVFQGSAVPVWGPITPGNDAWFWPDIPRYRPDAAGAQELLKSISLEDRNGNGVVEDEKGTEARFTVLTERGVAWYEKGTAVLKDDLARVGIAIEVMPLEAEALLPRMRACDYDAIYYRPPVGDFDPAGNMDFWLSSGAGHFWNPSQKTPATRWERDIDTLMLEQTATLDPERRREQFILVQRILAENLPVLYFAAPRMYFAHGLKVRGVAPSVLGPPVLWNADSLSVQ